ncbi:MAG: hypothetical protein AAGA54_14530 [Myxococcota bacterium]
MVFRAEQSCPARLVETQRGLRTDADVPPVQCDCSCNAAEGLDCSTQATLQRTSDENCLLFESEEPVATKCTPLNNVVGVGDDIIVNVDGEGSCAPEATVTIPPPTLSTALTVCSAEVASSCGDGATCLPAAVPQAGRICIWQVGDHDCPDETGYFERTLAHAGFEDNRGCEPCTCGAPSGHCQGALELYGAPGCSGDAALSVPVDDCTTDAPAAVAAQYVAQPVGAASCEPSPGTPNGSVDWVDTTTICCTPRG